MSLAYQQPEQVTGARPFSPPEPVRGRVGRGALSVVAAAVVAAGVVARFVTTSELWLDESLSVNIARLGTSGILEALRADGSPPLYYFLLYGWTELFGTGTAAVRALSGVFGVLVIPLVWAVARRYGSRVAWTAMVLVAVNPFAIRYSSETRMYSMIMVAVLAGWLAMERILADRGPGRGAQVGLALATAAVIHLHYWSFYLVAVVVGVLVARWRRSGPPGGAAPTRAAATRALAAIAVGGATFVVWLPTFLSQLASTGTPWGRPGSARSLVDAVNAFAGGFDEPGILGGAALLVMVVVAVFARREGSLLVVHPRAVGPGAGLAGVVFGTVAVAVVVGQVGDSAFAIRYASVVFPMFVVLVALGVTAFSGTRAFPVLMVLLVATSSWSATSAMSDDRTSATQVAFHLRSLSAPGDVVAYCPDQLGPSVHRLVADQDLAHLTYPRRAAPDLVDWRGYNAAIAEAPVGGFARFVDQLAGESNSVWLVWAPGYRGFSTRCQSLVTQLENLRPDHSEVRVTTTGYFEKPQLMRFRPSSPPVVVA